MTNDSFVNIRAMAEILKKILPDRKNIDRYMINNVRTNARKKS